MVLISHMLHIRLFIDFNSHSFESLPSVKQVECTNSPIASGIPLAPSRTPSVPSVLALFLASLSPPLPHSGPTSSFFSPRPRVHWSVLIPSVAPEGSFAWASGDWSPVWKMPRTVSGGGIKKRAGSDEKKKKENTRVETSNGCGEPTWEKIKRKGWVSFL